MAYEGEAYLIATPRQTCHKYEHTGNTQESTNEVNLLNNIHLRQSLGVNSGWWEVEDDGHDESDCSPDTTQDTAISPSCMFRDQLGPHDGRAERHDGEYQDGNVFSTLSSGREFRGDSQSSKFVDPSACASNSHTSYDCQLVIAHA